MAKKCPNTGEVVLYLDCQECEDKISCREKCRNAEENKKTKEEGK